MEIKFPIYLSNERIFSNSQKAINIAELRKIGEHKEGKVIYTSYEAFYLQETKKAVIKDIKKEKPLSENELMSSLTKKDKEFHTKYIVFRNLKNKGYIVKTGLKFGEEFRVYKKQDKHARWIVYPIKSTEKINPKDLISKSRISHSTGKKLLLAIVDSEEDISFYEIDWIKP